MENLTKPNTGTFPSTISMTHNNDYIEAYNELTHDSNFLNHQRPSNSNSITTSNIPSTYVSRRQLKKKELNSYQQMPAYQMREFNKFATTIKLTQR
jgi:hypothetical protein